MLILVPKLAISLLAADDGHHTSGMPFNQISAQTVLTYQRPRALLRSIPGLRTRDNNAGSALFHRDCTNLDLRFSTNQPGRQRSESTIRYANLTGHDVVPHS